MFLLDNLLMAPGKGVMFLFKELARKAQEEWLDDDSLKQELQEMYALFEAGKISEREFEERECRIVERLQQIARAKYQQKWGTQTDIAEAIVSEFIPDLPAEAETLIETSVQPLMNVPPEPAAPALLPPAPPPLQLPPVEAVPAPQPAPIAAPPVETPAGLAPSRPAGGLTLNQAIDGALRGLSLLNLKVSSITGVTRTEDGWTVAAELVERRGVPDTSDLLGLYELRLDDAGNVVRWERTRMRRRCDLGR